MQNERDAGIIRREIERQCSIGAGTCSYDGEGIEASGLLTVNADLDIATLDRALSDPSAVHLNMLRGGIAKPTPTNIWHLYGDDALIAAMPQSARSALCHSEEQIAENANCSDAGTVERALRLEALEIAARAYFDSYVQDEASDDAVEFCCSPAQHACAVAFKDALDDVAALSRLDGENLAPRAIP